jgi:hypothetical protein
MQTKTVVTSTLVNGWGNDTQRQQTFDVTTAPERGDMRQSDAVHMGKIARTRR